MGQKHSDLLLEAQKLNSQMAEALARGDLQTAQDLQAALQRTLKASAIPKKPIRPRPPLSKLPSVRERAIAALSELDVPSSASLIASYSEARTGEPFDLRAIASIRRDETRSWNSGSRRATYLVPALEAPYFVAGRGRFCLSHWPLWKRVITPLSTRTDHLKVCLHLADHVSSTEVGESDEPMRRLLREYAVAISGTLRHSSKAGNGEVDAQAIRDLARAELRLIEKDDEQARKVAAERAGRTLDEQQQLWGAQPPQVIAGG